MTTLQSVPIDKLLGGLLIGVIVSSFAYGVTCLQVYVYFTENSSRDSKALKLFVAGLTILDGLHVALVSHAIYTYTITNFGNYGLLYTSIWSLILNIPVANVVASCVQVFFANRVYHLSKERNRWTPAIICCISCGQLIGAFGLCISEFRSDGNLAANALHRPWPYISAIANLSCDLTITVAMIFYLNRSRTQFARTNRAINMLITYSLNTGLLTTIFTILTIVVLVTENPHWTIEFPFYFLLARLYPCSLVSTLNCRGVVRAAIADGSRHDANFVSLSHISGTAATSTSTSTMRRNVLEFKPAAETETNLVTQEQEDFGEAV